jgi:tetratricopeptide (TPR) repeat protein
MISRTTSGALALRNLDARIDGLALSTAHGPPPVEQRVALIESLSLRAHVVGRIADAERAAELAERLGRDAPADAGALVARARARSALHRFSDAWQDLDAAQRAGLDPEALEDERAGIDQAVGRYDDALAARRAAAKRHRTFSSLAALAGVHAQRREVDLAERLFGESRGLYRGVSPVPLAMLDFQHGHLWLLEGELARARTRFRSALRRLPGYAPARGHLAQIDAALGNGDAAIVELARLTASSDDPEYAAMLASVLSEAGRHAESAPWRAHAARRYEELLGRHEAAFADHAADFWLGVGGDPERAVELARINLDVRRTPRAHELLGRAVRAREGARTRPLGPCEPARRGDDGRRRVHGATSQ